MHLSQKTGLRGLVWLIAAALAVQAGSPVGRVAAGAIHESCAEYLRHGPSMRSRAMGGGYVSLADDADAMTYNPAGLMTVRGPELTASIESPAYQTYASYVGLAIPRTRLFGRRMGRCLSLGAGWLHLQSQGLEPIDEGAWGILKSDYSAGAVLIGAAYGATIGNLVNANVGVARRFAYQSGHDFHMIGCTDIGLQVQTLDRSALRFGMVCQNIEARRLAAGTVTGASIPATFRFGVDRGFSVRDDLTLRPVLEAVYARGIDSETKFCAGGEATWKVDDGAAISFRGGYNGALDAWTLGFGVDLTGGKTKVAGHFVAGEYGYDSSPETEPDGSMIGKVGVSLRLSDANTPEAHWLAAQAACDAGDSTSALFYARLVLANQPNEYADKARELIRRDVPSYKAEPVDTIKPNATEEEYIPTLAPVETVPPETIPGDSVKLGD